MTDNRKKIKVWYGGLTEKEMTEHYMREYKIWRRKEAEKWPMTN